MMVIFGMWGNWRTDIIPNVQYSERCVKKICRFLTMDSGTTMHANAWSKWASSNKGILQNRLPFNIRWDCDVPKKISNLGASVLINHKLCTLNPPKKNMHTSWEQSFQSTARLPMYLFLIPGISPHQNAPLLLQSLATQESLRQVHARIDPIPPGTWKKNCWIFAREYSLKKQHLPHLPPPAPLRNCSPS